MNDGQAEVEPRMGGRERGEREVGGGGEKKRRRKNKLTLGGVAQ